MQSARSETFSQKNVCRVRRITWERFSGRITPTDRHLAVMRNFCIIFIRFEATPKGVASLLSKIRGVVKMNGYDLRQDFGIRVRKKAKL